MSAAEHAFAGALIQLHELEQIVFAITNILDRRQVGGDHRLSRSTSVGFGLGSHLEGRSPYSHWCIRREQYCTGIYVCTPLVWIPCHILLQSSGPTCPNPVEYLSGGRGSLQFCSAPPEKDHFSQFSEWRRCMCVSDESLKMNHDPLCFVGSSGARMRHRYVVNEDHHQDQCCLNICDLCLIRQGFPIVTFVWVISFIWSPSRSQPHYLNNCCQAIRRKQNQRPTTGLVINRTRVFAISGAWVIL